MSAGRTETPDLFCVHVDRMIMSHTGIVRKSTIPVNLDRHVEVPILTSGTTVELACYTPIAAMTHLGHTDGGHYQALLKCLSGDSDHPRPHWLHCDDLRHPRLCDQLPTGCAAGINFVWLCRQDRTELHSIPTMATAPTALPASTDADHAILAMLTDVHVP